MSDWYYSYIHSGSLVTGAVRTPDIKGLDFLDVRYQLIIPYLCAQGVSELNTLAQAEITPGIDPIPADQIAESVTVDGVRYSLGTGGKRQAAEPAPRELVLRPVTRNNLPQAAVIWNGVVDEGISFPGDEMLGDDDIWAMFMAQSASVVALDGNEVVGVYILHPNNIGRCAHIANASYAVRADRRGHGVGRALVEDCIARAKALGFHGLQFNAVVSSNTAAIALYLKLGFYVLGTVPGGYRCKDGGYRDTLIMLKTWDKL